MMINDPLSDMIARIRNAHMRKRSKVLTPASRLRQRVLDVLQDEGYIRGYSLVQNPGEFPQFEIELKYFDGQPVIAEIARPATMPTAPSPSRAAGPGCRSRPAPSPARCRCAAPGSMICS